MDRIAMAISVFLTTRANKKIMRDNPVLFANCYKFWTYILKSGSIPNKFGWVPTVTGETKKKK